jgi:hypothetical protein
MKLRFSLLLVILVTLVACGGTTVPAATNPSDSSANTSDQSVAVEPTVQAPTAAKAAEEPAPEDASAEEAQAEPTAVAEEAAVVEEIPEEAAVEAIASDELPHTLGQIIVQVQIPSSADQPPTLHEHSGMTYFNIPLSTGEAIQLLAVQGLKWTNIEPRNDSATEGIINYWFYGEPLEGSVILQAQIPTSSDKAPQLNEFNGMKYIVLQTSKDAFLHIIPVQGFEWSEVQLNPDSANPEIINYWFKASAPVLEEIAPVVEANQCPEGWTICRTLESPTITLVGSRLVSQAAMDSVAHIYQDMLNRLKPEYPTDVFNGFTVYITNGEAWSELQNLAPVGTMWPGTVEKGIPQGDDLRGGASNRFLWIEEQMICKTGVATRNAAYDAGLRARPDNTVRTFDQVVHEFSHSIHMNYGLDEEIKGIFNTSGMSPIERFPWAVQNKFGTPAGNLTAAEQAYFDKIFASTTTYTCDLYQP